MALGITAFGPLFTPTAGKTALPGPRPAPAPDPREHYSGTACRQPAGFPVGPRASSSWLNKVAKIDEKPPIPLATEAEQLCQFAELQRSRVGQGLQNDANAIKKVLHRAAGLAHGNQDDYVKLVSNVLVDLNQTPETARDFLAVDKENPNKYCVFFNDTGFKESLRDGMGNLPHHMGFYFAAGYFMQKYGADLGSMVGVGGVVYHEGEASNGNMADMRSGQIGIGMGRYLATNPGKLEFVDQLWEVNSMVER